MAELRQRMNPSPAVDHRAQQKRRRQVCITRAVERKRRATDAQCRHSNAEVRVTSKKGCAFVIAGMAKWRGAE